MTLIAETQEEGQYWLLINNTARELVNAILFDSEDVPPEIAKLTQILAGACILFDEAQENAKLIRKLRDAPPEGEA